jgi:hypothetical protein
MTLLTEAPGVGPHSVGIEGGAAADCVVLDHEVVRDMRWCANCGGEQVFVEVYEFAAGRVGFCLGCGEERVIPFTRTNSEAA